MKVLVDMNLSPEWVEVLQQAGIDSVHWSEVGRPNAPDTELMAWALQEGSIVFTNDLDFGRLLALTFARGPSVLQVRDAFLLPEDIAESVIATLRQEREALEKGALVVLTDGTARVRVLPIQAIPRSG